MAFDALLKMTKRPRVARILIAVVVIGFAGVPVRTEIRIQSAKHCLRNASSVSDCTAIFGAPSRKAGSDLKSILTERLSLDVTDSDEILIFQREGIPYWAIYLVTPDGERISDSAVDRFW